MSPTTRSGARNEGSERSQEHQQERTIESEDGERVREMEQQGAGNPVRDAAPDPDPASRQDNGTAQRARGPRSETDGGMPGMGANSSTDPTSGGARADTGEEVDPLPRTDADRHQQRTPTAPNNDMTRDELREF